MLPAKDPLEDSLEDILKEILKDSPRNFLNGGVMTTLRGVTATVDASFEIIPRGFHSFSIFPFDFKKFFIL